MHLQNQRARAVLPDAPILVTGAGVSGAGAVRLLCHLGATVAIADDNAEALTRVVAAHDGHPRPLSVAEAQRCLADFGLVVTSPGWNPRTPLLQAARDAGIEVIGDVELCWRLDHAEVFGPARTWLVVTGTNGKTTATGMLTAMMQRGARRAEAVGNIGWAVEDALLATERVDVLVAELSSFQLYWSSELRPDGGVLLNLAEDHLDWHGGMADYADSKGKALRGPVAVAGIDDPHVRELLARQEVTDYVGFTRQAPEPGQYGVQDGYLVDYTGPSPVRLRRVAGLNPAGVAGVYDALAAAALARSQGISAADIAAALDTFSVARHRGEIIAEHQGVVFVDNSKATNPHAADAALAGLDSVIWIVGGQLKGASLDDVVTAHAHRLKAAIVLGVDAALVTDALARLAPALPVYEFPGTDKDAVSQQIAQRACELAQPGDTVLLAPAAASLDMFSGMAERGDLFAHHVRASLDQAAQRAE